ncbi:MAG: hypothetical protein JWN48_3578 [Myxococcaceae bacterium]|nr:hypothetical protein [Myxococcaceae bacterium]
MPLRRDPPQDRGQVGQSRFAQRGQSHEERMSEDDSAQRFPGEGRTRQDARYDAQQPAPRDGYYGSGGSYGYGGGFDHRGESGYQERPERGSYGRGEEFYETSGGFGREVGGYGRQGLGYPGSNEDRYGSPGARGSQREPHTGHDDPRAGYSQDSGYAQSGGQRRENTGQGSGYRSSDHSDGHGHQGGGRPGRFFGSSSSAQQPGRGRFYGRMPQGYSRSDERIREDICDQLSHGHIDPSEISVKVESGVVTLEGFASNRAEKFHIEEVADAVLGVKDIDNRVRIRREDGRGSALEQGADSQRSTHAQQPDKQANEITEGNLDAGPPKGRGNVRGASS